MGKKYYDMRNYVNDNIQLYQCPECGEYFARVTNFNFPEKIMHTRKCPYCKNYRRHSKWGIHTSILTNTVLGKVCYSKEGFIVCHLCNKGFINLPRHLTRHHNMTAEKYKEICKLPPTTVLHLKKEVPN